MDSIVFNIAFWDPWAGGDRRHSPINFPFLYAFGLEGRDFGMLLSEWLVNDDFLTRCNVLDKMSDNSKHVVHYYLNNKTEGEVFETVIEN